MGNDDDATEDEDDAPIDDEALDAAAASKLRPTFIGPRGRGGSGTSRRARLTGPRFRRGTDPFPSIELIALLCKYMQHFKIIIRTSAEKVQLYDKLVRLRL